MQMNKAKEEKMKRALEQNVKSIEPSDQLFNNIRNEINRQECKETMGSRFGQWRTSRKAVAVLTCCVLLLSSTAVVGSTLGKQWISYSNNNQYMTFPTEQQVSDDIGFSPKYVEELPGGFTFDRAGIGEGELQDAEGEALTTTKNITFGYTREGDKKPLALMVEQVQKEFISSEIENIVGTVNGLELDYYEQNYKFVPPDYELTEEDQLAMAQGKLEVSYGANEISNEVIQGISWYEDGLRYMIMGNDFNFSVEEMIAMAEVVINR